jgi:hypothetical protein
VRVVERGNPRDRGEVRRLEVGVGDLDTELRLDHQHQAEHGKRAMGRARRIARVAVTQPRGSGAERTLSGSRQRPLSEGASSITSGSIAGSCSPSTAGRPGARYPEPDAALADCQLGWGDVGADGAIQREACAGATVSSTTWSNSLLSPS